MGTTSAIDSSIRQFKELQSDLAKACNDILNRTLDEMGGEIPLNCPDYDSWDDAWEREGHCYPANLCPVSFRMLMSDGYMHEIYPVRVYREDGTGIIRYEGYDDEEGYVCLSWNPGEDLNQMVAMVQYIQFIRKDG